MGITPGGEACRCLGSEQSRNAPYQPRLADTCSMMIQAAAQNMQDEQHQDETAHPEHDVETHRCAGGHSTAARSP